MAIASLAMRMNGVPVPVTAPPGFQQIYQEYSGAVYKTALRVTGNPADAEDVLQTVFLRVLNQQTRFEDGWSPEHYLRRAATNASIDVIRKRTTQAESPIDEGRDKAAHGTNVVLKERLRQAIAKLDPQEGEMFILRHLEGLSYEELAEHFGVERGTVASRLHRIRQALQKEIEK